MNLWAQLIWSPLRLAPRTGFLLLAVASLIALAHRAGLSALSGYGPAAKLLAASAVGFGLVQVIGLALKAASRPGTAEAIAEPPASWQDNVDLGDLPVALLRLKDDGTIFFANRTGQNLLGHTSLQGRKIQDFVEGVGRPITARLRETVRGEPRLRSEIVRCKTVGEDKFFQVNLARVANAAEPRILAVLNDATELKALEAQFVQSQKMQAVGQLAGGVAHDFNNLLTAINGHCDLLLLRHAQGDFDYADLMQIRQNSARAAALVRQLLAYSRKQTLQLRTIDLGVTLAELSHLLTRLLSEKITLEIDSAADLCLVRVDERQFEQVIMNLVVNARDAMPLGGRIKIRGRNLLMAKDTERGRAMLPAGSYALVEVSDTGTGMTSDQLGKIFEPFYTTKRLGEGTGLGLSTAYGIIKQTGGYIFAKSTVGEGTSFSIYLPAESRDETAELPAEEVAAATVRVLPARGRILLAEDETAVRSFTARALRLRGYSVVEANSGEAALEILRDRTLDFDMFISDVIMPGLDGPGWVRIARADRPQVPVLFVSGYAEDSFEDGAPRIESATFLPKPYSLHDLTRVVGEQLSVLAAAG